MKNIFFEMGQSKRRKMKELGDEYQHKNTKTKTQDLGIQWVCDFETLTENTKAFQELQDTRVILWAVRRRDAIDDGQSLEYKEYKIKHYQGRNIRQKEFYDYKGFICGTCGDSFIDFVLNSPSNCTFFFHNLKYDGTFIVPLLMKQKGLNQVHYNLIENNRIELEGMDENGLKVNYWDTFRDGRKIYNIKIRKWGAKNKITINFRCTYLMLSSSVKALGDALSDETFNGITLKKFINDEKEQGEDFYNVEPCENLEDIPKNFFEYCLRDVEIVRRHVNYFHDLFNQELPTIKQANQFKKEHNELETKKGNKTKHNKYKDELNVWGMGITIAGTMRKLLHLVYVPMFQYNNDKFKESVKYRHIDKTFGNMAITSYNTHSFFTEKYDFYGEDKISNNSKFFRGGFTQFNPVYQNLKDLYDIGDAGKWDVSSAYPFQMTFPLPFGEIIEEDDFVNYYNDLKENEYYEYLIIPIKKATPKENAHYCATLPNLTYTENARFGRNYRYVPVEQTNFTLAVVRQEWDELNHWYDFEVDDEIAIKKCYMLAAPFLQGIAEELYNEKNRFSKEGKSAQKQGVKIAINSVYGSLGIRAEFSSLVYANNELYNYLDDKHKMLVCEKKGKDVNIEFLHACEFVDSNFKAIRIKEEREFGECWNIAAASTITALERVYLMKTIRTIGAKYFAYCDTDSIIFANMSQEARARMEYIERTPASQTGLGNWEVEYRYIKGFSVHKAKEYIQYIYAYDDKRKTFVDKEGNPCEKEKAHIKTSIKGAGFVLPNDDKINELFALTIPKRQELTKQQIQEYYKDIEIDDYFVERIKKGDTLIINGEVITKSYPSGDIIIKKNKWTSYGVN